MVTSSKLDADTLKEHIHRRIFCGNYAIPIGPGRGI